MTTPQALVLGAFQGIAEFLPISSSGHLLVFKRLIGLDDVPLLFDVTLHVATLLSVVVVFRARLAEIFAAIRRWLVRKPASDDGAILSIVLPGFVATCATAVIGLGISKFLPEFGPLATSVCFIVTAGILVATNFFRGSRDYAKLGPAGGLLVGIAQGVGVLPGISRSGITIAGGLAAGLDRDRAGEFAFLLSIPAILGALLLDLKDLDTLAGAVGFGQLAIASLAAFVVGIVALSLLIPLVKKGKLAWFALYLVPAGILGIAFFR